MTRSLAHVDAISLFVEDLAAARAFYQDVFGAAIVFEDDASTALRFDHLIVNLLQVENAAEIVAPGAVAPAGRGARSQLSVFVPDIAVACARLRQCRVSFNGPVDRPWGMRTVNFVDPAGHSWEMAQDVSGQDTGAAQGASG